MTLLDELQSTVVQKSFVDRKAYLEWQIENLEHEYEKILQQKVTKPQRIWRSLSKTYPAGIGVYFIIHCNKDVDFFEEQHIFKYKENVKIMYIGQGQITGRKSIHLRIYKNKGKPCVWENGDKITSSVDSVAGRKMYEYDSNIDNWYFSYITTGKDWSPIIENYFINELKPEFNDEKMNGVA